ncbi:Hypothetical predicted protein [Olea europaea subsp. europaea]|uniref:FAR1 domain-containing protein n=1 Tax=Olea europaea subsp. europaea TaxID=158383 RepID=A0A8S0RAU4_OLEEU|nr:Hypothetical predicted protein [Olea europaea subsp. europaea]
MDVVDDEVLVESNNESSLDNVITLGGDNLGGDVANIPKVGMKFNDENELYEFQKKYVYDVGFSVRRRNSKKGEEGIVRYVTLTCSCEGRRSYNTSASLRPQPTIQVGYKARLTASADIFGIWKICTIDSSTIIKQVRRNLGCIDAIKN